MKIQARVLDVYNEPLVGVNVLVVNNGIKTTVGSATDFNGNFTIDSSLLTNSSVLQVSYVGFQTRNVTIPELVDENFDIYLLETGFSLNDVEIIGTPKKKGLGWWWLLIAGAVGFGIYKATEKKPKKVTI